MKKLVVLVIVAALAYWFLQDGGGSIPDINSRSQDSDQALQAAFEKKLKNYQVQGEGVVKKILPDDNEGSRHQRFLLQLGSGQTLLVAHNIDLAPRIDRLKKGDTVAFFGEYEWTSKGGVVHWTHHDPDGRHVAGWLRHDGKTYQ